MEFGDATREVERRLDRVGEPALDPFADKTVDDNGNVVRLIALELEFVLLVEIDELPVDDGPDEPLAGEVGKQGVVGASALDDRSEDLESQSSPSSRSVDDLLGCLAHQLFTRLGIVRDTDTSEQEAQIVVQLGDGADRRPRFRLADFWSIEIAGESPSRKSTSGLSICPRTGGRRRSMTPRTDAAPRHRSCRTQGSLARPGQTGEHDELVAASQIDLAEIVFTGALDDETIGHRRTLAVQRLPNACSAGQKPDDPDQPEIPRAKEPATALASVLHLIAEAGVFETKVDCGVAHLLLEVADQALELVLGKVTEIVGGPPTITDLRELLGDRRPFLGWADHRQDVGDLLADRLGVDPVFFVVGLLQTATPHRLRNRPLHRIGHLIGIHDDLTCDVSRRPADHLDQRRLAAQEPLFVGVEDRDEGDFGQVEPLAK